MKKLVCMLLLIQSGFVMAQKETFVTINGKKVQMDPNSLNTADNGLTANAGNVQLGGALLKPTTLTTTAANTLTIGGLQTGASTDNVLVADANGVLKWVTRASLGDNLGNHTATQDLDMSGKNVKNIFNAYVKNDLQIFDRTASNTDYFSLYKENGSFVINNRLKSTNDLTVNEANRRTTINNLAITTGTDGAAPATGYVATSADASGNVVWKPASSLGVSGDNLGNHTATQDLVMSSKNITGAANVTASGTVTGANITATTKTTTPAAQITTGAGAGKVAVSDASGNLTWTDPATITAKGDNLGNHTATQDLDMSSKNINNINAAKLNTKLLYLIEETLRLRILLCLNQTEFLISGMLQKVPILLK